MQTMERYVVYPDSDTQEISWPLSLNSLVDLNGMPLALPLDSVRVIAYRVIKIRKTELPGIETVFYHLELVPAFELGEFLG
jgi:hypothetical protein